MCGGFEGSGGGSVVTRLSVLCSYLKRWTFKLGHSLNQIRPLGVKTGQYLKGIIPQCMFQQAAEIRTPHITNVNAQAAPIRNLSALCSSNPSRIACNPTSYKTR